MRSPNWPVAAIVAAAVAGFVAMYVFTPDPTTRQALIALLAPVVTGALSWFLARRVDQVSERVETVADAVNGHTEELINRIPVAEQPAARRAAQIIPPRRRGRRT